MNILKENESVNVNVNVNENESPNVEGDVVTAIDREMQSLTKSDGTIDVEKLTELIGRICKRLDRMEDIAELDKVEEDHALPRREKFQLTDKQQQLFDKAIAAGLMEVAESKYHWLESASLLAYFAGRVFCDDRPTANAVGDGVFWDGGGKRFPSSKVCWLFDVNDISNYRRKRILSTPPMGHTKVDKLF